MNKVKHPADSNPNNFHSMCFACGQENLTGLHLRFDFKENRAICRVKMNKSHLKGIRTVYGQQSLRRRYCFRDERDSMSSKYLKKMSV
jgi:hypothetical protein